MFPISFNAFGDIVTAAQILYGIAKSLNETHGAPEEYRRFVGYLHEMGALMMRLHSMMSTGPPNPELRHIVLSKIEECCAQVEAGLDRVAGLNSLSDIPEAGSASPGQVIRRGFQKVEWHFRYRGDVGKVQEEMHTVLQSLQVVVAFVNHSTTVDIGQQTSAIHRETRATRTMLDLLAIGSIRAQKEAITLNANLLTTREHVQTMRTSVMEMVDQASVIQEDVRAARRDSAVISAEVQELDSAVMQAMGIVSAVHEDTQTLLMLSATAGRNNADMRTDVHMLDRRTREMLQVLTAVQDGLAAVQSRISGVNKPLPLESMCPWCTAAASKMGLPKDYIWTLPCCGRQCHLGAGVSSHPGGACDHVIPKSELPSVPRIHVTPSSPRPYIVGKPSPKRPGPQMGWVFTGAVSPASSYAYDLETDRWVTDNGFQLHWQLLPHDDLGIDRPQMYFDIRYSASNASHVRDGYSSPVSEQYLERFATRRPLPRMTFTLDGIPGYSLIVARPLGVRVCDVLERVQEVLKAPLDLREKRLGYVKRCWSHYEKRLSQERLLDDSYVNDGMRRLDLLEGRFIFGGCQWRPPRDNFPDGSWTLLFTHPVWRYGGGD